MRYRSSVRGVMEPTVVDIGPRYRRIQTDCQSIALITYQRPRGLEVLVEFAQVLASEFQHRPQMHHTHPADHFLHDLLQCISCVVSLCVYLLLHLDEAVPKCMEEIWFKVIRVVLPY